MALELAVNVAAEMAVELAVNVAEEMAVEVAAESTLEICSCCCCS